MDFVLPVFVCVLGARVHEVSSVLPQLKNMHMFFGTLLIDPSYDAFVMEWWTIQGVTCPPPLLACDPAEE